MVDLGCGSGQLLRYLALRRPDLHLVGIDLSEPMVLLGNAILREAALSDRVNLTVADMTSTSLPSVGDVDLVTSIFSLHHLPTMADLWRCLTQIERTRRECGAGFWVFDHARPHRRHTAELFPHIFTPRASTAFKVDLRNSLIASWSYDELRTSAASALTGNVHSSRARWLPVYQVHWAIASRFQETGIQLWQDAKRTPRAVQRDRKSLKALFTDLPV